MSHMVRLVSRLLQKRLQLPEEPIQEADEVDAAFDADDGVVVQERDQLDGQDGRAVLHERRGPHDFRRGQIVLPIAEATQRDVIAEMALQRSKLQLAGCGARPEYDEVPPPLRRSAPERSQVSRPERPQASSTAPRP